VKFETTLSGRLPSDDGDLRDYKQLVREESISDHPALDTQADSEDVHADKARISVVPVHIYLREIKDHGLGRGRFARLPKSVILQTAKQQPGLLALYALLMTYVPFTGKGSECFPSIETLAEELGKSKSTIGRWLNGLKALRLVTTRKDGKRTKYTLYAPYSPPSADSTGSETLHPRTRQAANLQPTAELAQVENQDPDSTIDTNDDREREILKRDIEREKQDCSLRKKLKRKLTDLHLTAQKADELLDEYGLKNVAAALKFVRGRPNARNPAGLLITYLESDGWKRQRRLKEYLKEMPDPDTSAERTRIAAEIVSIFGSKKDTVNALAQLMEEEGRLSREAETEAQRDVAWFMFCRAREAKYYVEDYFLTEEEKETARLLEKAAMRAYWEARAKQESSKTKRARRSQMSVT